MEYELNTHLKEELSADEQLLWHAQPNPNILFTPLDFFLVPFSLFWTSTVVYFFVSSLLKGFSFFALPFLSFFLLMGFYITIGRFLNKRSLKKKTLYALTNKRVIEISIGRLIRKKSLSYSQIKNINCNIRRNKNGSITFGNGSLSKMFTGFYANSGMDIFIAGNASREPALYDINNADVPASIIKKYIK